MKYKSKPKIIDAYEFNGDGFEAMHWIGNFIQQGEENPSFIRLGQGLIIKTLEGEMHVSDGDFIIRGLRGEFYPCKPDIFHKSCVARRDYESKIENLEAENKKITAALKFYADPKNYGSDDSSLITGNKSFDIVLFDFDRNFKKKKDYAGKRAREALAGGKDE